MSRVPKNIQAQLCEAIKLIADCDYYKGWDTLLPSLVEKIQSPDQTVVNGALTTMDAIFKNFQHSVRSDALYDVILYSLKHTQEPLTRLALSIGQAVDQSGNDKGRLESLFSALRLIFRIFYSLNYQDLPEFFEDNLQTWMDVSAKYLTYTNPILVDNDEELEPGPIDKLQGAIVTVLNLYAEKDEESFLPFLANFTQMVWSSLEGVSQHPKHDNLATTCIRFLSSLIRKPMHKHIFQGEATLQTIVTNIVLKNIVIREVSVLLLLVSSLFKVLLTLGWFRSTKNDLRMTRKSISKLILRGASPSPEESAVKNC